MSYSFLRIATLSLLLVSGATLVRAESVPAEQAAEMLARAQSVDVKCNYLAAAQKDDLSRLVARAELALANRESIDATKATMQRGHEAGASVTCAEAEKQALNSILGAAREAEGPQAKAPAVAEAGKAPVNAAVEVAPPKPVVAAVPDNPSVRQNKDMPQANIQPPVQPLKPIKTVQVAVPKLVHAAKPKPLHIAVVHKAPVAPKPVKARGTLENYAKLTQTYYLARRCGKGSATKLYRSVVALHGQVMQGHSARQVASVLRSAEARASGTSCS
jgi:hypothetical protein